MNRRRIRKHRAERKLNRRVQGKAIPGAVKEACTITKCIICTVAAFFCSDVFLLQAEAAPATLSSPDATVYEQASEGSSAIGNLVEGSSFEYIGDVTAEDGSVWHQITTASGTTGYIKGDIEMGEEEPVPEGEGAPEGEAAAENAPQEGGNPAPAENGEENTPEGGNTEGDRAENQEEGQDRDADGEPDGEADREPDDEGAEEGDGENPEAEGDNEADGLPADNHEIENHQAKSYALSVSGRIKGKEGVLPVMNMDNTSMKNEKASLNIDKTLVLSLAVIFFCTEAAYLCWKRIKRIKNGTEGNQVPNGTDNRLHRKIDKKKRSQKKKSKKK